MESMGLSLVHASALFEVLQGPFWSLFLEVLTPAGLQLSPGTWPTLHTPPALLQLPVRGLRPQSQSLPTCSG